jgi:histidinol dehydrogenase
MTYESNVQKDSAKLQNETIHELRAKIDQMSKEANKLQNKTADEMSANAKIRNDENVALMHKEIEAFHTQTGQMKDKERRINEDNSFMHETIEGLNALNELQAKDVVN